MLDVIVSVAVRDCVPAVFKVAVNVPVPLVSAELAGSVAWPSLLVKWTVPAERVAVLPKESLAGSVEAPADPAVTDVGKPATTNVLAAAGLTVMPPSVPVMLEVAVSVAVSDCVPAVFKVAEKEPVPLDSVELAGSPAWPALVVKCTVPA